MSDDYSVGSHSSDILRTQRQRPDSRDSKASMTSRRVSSSMGRQLIENANNNNNDRKVEAEEPLKVTQDKVKFWEWNRRKDRIYDIAHMLEDNGALTQKEKDFLIDLGHSDKAKYNQIGRMLTVPMIGGTGYHGVTYREDRNRVRMQTLKAVLYEAMKTYDPNGSLEQRNATIDAALKMGRKVRWTLTRTSGGPLGPLGPNLKMHTHVTKDTLLDPRIIYRKYNRKLANQKLYRSMAIWPRQIHPAVSGRDQRRAAKAVELLVNNDLLSMDAAYKLMNDLKNNPDLISRMMADGKQRIEPRADREKMRALTLLALAYNNDRDEVKNKTAGLLATVDGNGVEIGSDLGTDYGGDFYNLSDTELDNNRGQLMLRHLPNLNRAGGSDPSHCNDWVEWAKPEDNIRFPSESIDLRSITSTQNNLKKPGIKVIEPEDTPGGQPIVSQDMEYKKGEADQNLIDKDDDLSGSKPGQIILDNINDDDLLNELIADEPPKDKNKTGTIPQKAAPALHEQKKDIESDQTNQFRLLDQGTNEDNRQGTGDDDYTSGSDMLSSMGSQKGDQTKHVRNETTIVHETVNDDFSDNDKEVDDLYSDDDNDNTLDDGKVTEAEEQRLAAKKQTQSVSSDDGLPDGPTSLRSVRSFVSVNDKGGVVMELNNKNSDDTKLITAMGNIRDKTWLEDPFGDNPYSAYNVKLSPEFHKASSELSQHLGGVTACITTWFALREDDSAIPLTLNQGPKDSTRTALLHATAAKSELESFQNKLNKQKIDPNVPNIGTFEKFKMKVGKAIEDLDAIIECTDGLHKRIMRASDSDRETTESLNNYSDNNNNNNNDNNVK